MIDFSAQNNSDFSSASPAFCGLKIPKINIPKLGLSGTKILSDLDSDTFQKTLQIPSDIIKDGIDEKTFNKARDFVMKSINAPKPKEGMVIINNGKIIQSKVCDERSGIVTDKKVLKLLKDAKNSGVIVHSHPKTSYGNTMPVSFTDFETLNKFQGLKSIYAIDTDGRYSMLKKTGKDKISDSAMENILENQYLTGYANWMNKIDDPECRDFVDLYKYLKYEFNGTEKQKLELLDEFSKLQDSIDDAGYAAGYVDSFWKKYADKLGVSYKTNFLNPD